MFIQHNLLRKYRKQAQLTHFDIAFLLDLSDDSSISRFEKGNRTPHLGLLLFYNLLFDVPIEILFQRQRQEMAAPLCKRIEALIENLGELGDSEKRQVPIAFLQKALLRLSQPHRYD